jgi:hypothetical protein
MITEQPDDHSHFNSRLEQGLAFLERGDSRNLFLTFQHQARRTRQHSRALLRRGIAPDPEAAPRRIERPVKIRGIGQRQLPEYLAARGIQDCVRTPLAHGNPLTVDDHMQAGITHGSLRYRNSHRHRPSPCANRFTISQLYVLDTI